MKIFKPQEIAHLLFIFYKKCQADEILTRASALAFIFIIGLLPLTILLLGVAAAIAYIQIPLFEFRLEDLLSNYLAPSFSVQVQKTLHQLTYHIRHGSLGAYSIFAIFLTTYSMARQMETTFHRIWGVKEMRTLKQRLLIYAFFFFIAPMLLSLSLSATTAALAWAKSLGSSLSGIAILISTLSPLIFTTMLFYFLHTILPAKKVHPATGIKVALLSAFVFELSKQSFTFYAVNIVGQSLYGSMATIPLFFLWAYVSWALILFGAEACYFLESHRLLRAQTNRKIPEVYIPPNQ